VRNETRWLLLTGCALILALDGPAVCSTLAEGWHGPYAPHAPRSTDGAEVRGASLEPSGPVRLAASSVLTATSIALAGAALGSLRLELP